MYFKEYINELMNVCQDSFHARDLRCTPTRFPSNDSTDRLNDRFSSGSSRRVPSDFFRQVFSLARVPPLPHACPRMLSRSRHPIAINTLAPSTEQRNCRLFCSNTTRSCLACEPQSRRRLIAPLCPESFARLRALAREPSPTLSLFNDYSRRC